jgi:hypothetical protein
MSSTSEAQFRGAGGGCPPSSGLRTWPWLAILAATMALVAVRGSQEIAANSEPYFNNDESRHIMTAAFFCDVLRVRPAGDPRGFAYAYYGHFPAIAPMHYPPMMHMITAAVFLAVGPGVEVARIIVLLMLLGLVAATFALARSSLGVVPATVAALFLVGAPMVEQFRAVFMLEVPCMFWMALTVLALRSYVTTCKARYIWLCAITATVAVLTKQHAVTLAAPLAIGAALGFGRQHWRSVHTYIGPAIGVGIAAAYYAASIGTVRGAWVDLASMPEENPWIYMSDLAWGLGPVAIALAVAGLVVGLIRRQLGWIDWVALGWALAVVALHALVVRTCESRYFIYAAPAVAIMAGAGFHRLGLTRTRVLRGAGAAVVIALCWYQAAEMPQAALAGYRAAALEAGRLSDGAPVMFSGTWDGPFVLYRRLDDPGLTTVTYRASKMLGGGNILASRLYTAYVNSPEEVRQRFAETGAELVVSEDSPEINSREHLWFWDWIHSPDFKEINTLPVTLPDGRQSHLHLMKYLGPHAVEKHMTIHMMTLRENAIAFDLDRPLIHWNDTDKR